jgi:dolichyl-phosphate beta-glucosyltransferase
MREFKLSVVVPFYNAEGFITDSLFRLTQWQQTLDYSVELVIVNDGSTDESAQVVREFIKNGNADVCFISYSVNRGKGNAVKLGMLSAKGKYRIFTDVDIPFGLSALNEMLYNLEFKEYDVCIGNRKSIRSNYFVAMTPARRMASTFFTMIISRYVVTGVNDTQCGLKGFKADVAEKLFKNLQVRGFAFDVELLYLSFKYELEIKRMPVTFEGNLISTVSLGRNSVQMLWDILCLPLRYHFTDTYRQHDE